MGTPRSLPTIISMRRWHEFFFNLLVRPGVDRTLMVACGVAAAYRFFRRFQPGHPTGDGYGIKLMAVGFAAWVVGMIVSAVVKRWLGIDEYSPGGGPVRRVLLAVAVLITLFGLPSLPFVQVQEG